MKYTYFSIVVLLLFYSCGNSYPKAYDKPIVVDIVDSLKEFYSNQHEKYRTFWYRTSKDCFYDSTRKYGLLYDSICGYHSLAVLRVDTTQINEPATCK